MDTGGCTRADYDLVVLAQGVTPPADCAGLAGMLGLGLAEDGFLQAPADPAGVFVSGACALPMRITECVEDAMTVAGRVFAYLGGLQ
jgi:heterodisulfide reductase subunit A-like polyferredoxin